MLIQYSIGSRAHYKEKSFNPIWVIKSVKNVTLPSGYARFFIQSLPRKPATKVPCHIGRTENEYDYTV